MFGNKNFNMSAHLLMIFSVVLGYETLFNYSKKLNISWVNVSINKYDIHATPPLHPAPIGMYMCVASFFIATCIALHKCNSRVIDKEISWKEGRKEIIKTILNYFLCFIVLLICYPVLGRIIRGW